MLIIQTVAQRQLRSLVAVTIRTMMADEDRQVQIPHAALRAQTEEGQSLQHREVQAAELTDLRMKHERLQRDIEELRRHREVDRLLRRAGDERRRG